MFIRRFLTSVLLLYGVLCQAQSYRIITPEPFAVVGRNYMKLQVLKQHSAAKPDSVIFDLLYNSGQVLHQKTDASFSAVISLNNFNDGVFYAAARVFHNAACDTLGSIYSPSGMPVILDRNPGINTSVFYSDFLAGEKTPVKTDTTHYIACNNNRLAYTGYWDADSLYLDFDVKDAHLNAVKAGRTDLFQRKGFLSNLWDSDCLEIGLDMQHDRSVWKRADDLELLVDVAGKFSGNQWDAQKNLFRHWGENVRVLVKRNGSLNDNDDTDIGYVVNIAIPWKDLGRKPVPGMQVGFDIQLYDKDAELDEAFRTSISGTNPESNDNTSEWTTLQLRKNPVKTAYLWWLSVVPVLITAYFLRKRRSVPAPLQQNLSPQKEPVYSKSVTRAMLYIGNNYQLAELSRQDIAEHVFLSEKYLSSLFARETGTHLIAYINQYRIEKAIALLQQTRLSVSEVAFKVGYSSVQNFNKNFKSVTGRPPSHYRA